MAIVNRLRELEAEASEPDARTGLRRARDGMRALTGTEYDIPSQTLEPSARQLTDSDATECPLARAEHPGAPRRENCGLGSRQGAGEGGRRGGEAFSP